MPITGLPYSRSESLTLNRSTGNRRYSGTIGKRRSSPSGRRRRRDGRSISSGVGTGLQYRPVRWTASSTTGLDPVAGRKRQQAWTKRCVSSHPHAGPTARACWGAAVYQPPRLEPSMRPAPKSAAFRHTALAGGDQRKDGDAAGMSVDHPVNTAVAGSVAFMGDQRARGVSARRARCTFAQGRAGWCSGSPGDDRPAVVGSVLRGRRRPAYVGDGWPGRSGAGEVGRAPATKGPGVVGIRGRDGRRRAPRRRRVGSPGNVRPYRRHQRLTGLEHLCRRR